MAQHLRTRRESGKTVVQCHGCFDIVHPGHVRYLQFARQLGDVLIVSLTGDELVGKGPDRPYIPQELRAENLAAFEFVDWVVIDPHPTACELLEQLRPDVYVKGREYADSHDPRFLREREIVESYGGRVVFHSGDVVFSSTRLIESLDDDAHLDECRLRALCDR
ncbi:MAG: cytidyltransferase, partial [Planctomycetota bacterium]